MKQQEIKIIKLVNGDDIVCVLPTGDRQLPDKAPLIRLEKPLQVKYVPQITPTGFRDYVALIKWTNYTNDQIVTIPKDKILTITNASIEMSNNYAHISNNYATMDKPQTDSKLPEYYQRPTLSAEQNKKMNEMLKEFEDNFDDEEEPTLH